MPAEASQPVQPWITTWQLLHDSSMTVHAAGKMCTLYMPLSLRGTAAALQTKLQIEGPFKNKLWTSLYRVTEPPQVYLIGPSKVPCANWRTMGSLVLSNSSVVPSQTTLPCTHSQDSMSACSIHLAK